MPRSLLKTAITIAASLVLGHAAAADHPSFKVDVTGQGAPVILIPGLGSPGEVWSGTVAHYCGKRQCHVLSLAGFAGQPAIGTPLIATVEQQLSDYIREHQLEHPVVIG
jgi:pimeloyl-ACP methyl ester carboxylesterase